MGWSGKKVLVTGADGFIGSHLVERLLELGADVTPFVFYNSFGSWGWLDTLEDSKKENLQVLSGDVRDEQFVRYAVKGMDCVFHLAALIAIPYSYYSPGSYVDTNIKGTLNVLQACREYGAERMVHTSTSETYGTARFVPMDEHHPLQGQSPYSASKIGADMLAESYWRSFATPVSIIRPFNTYGPRQSARAIIPTIITQIFSGKTEIELGSLHPTRDLNYVKDTVEGFIKVAESDQTVGTVTNIGTGKDISIGELAEKIIQLMGRAVNIISDEKRKRPSASEVERLCANNEKALSITGWKPIYTLEQGLLETITWIGNNMKYYKSDSYNI